MYIDNEYAGAGREPGPKRKLTDQQAAEIKGELALGNGTFRTLSSNAWDYKLYTARADISRH